MVRHAGWTGNLAGFQGPSCTSLQALPDPQESDSSGPRLWGVSKSYTGHRGPSQHCGYATRTRMCSNGRQGGNGEPHQQQPHIISEPNASTRNNFGAFQATAGTTSPEKNKYTTHKENSTRKNPRILNQSTTSGIKREPADWTIRAQPEISPIQDTK